MMQSKRNFGMQYATTARKDGRVGDYDGEQSPDDGVGGVEEGHGGQVEASDIITAPVH